ncbi:zinc finger protein GAI-ASSOCIATED FACTOR 1-like [Cornus florida]|uniref:zinc finger protein GAI-ASSOCIATED FACTOR 1-like n=1 Tax=Cornus florida TaxID=4283 RepID=UPI00289D8D6F|nr:zinc finger protein GAI-ASSOCIATED FACTOR 1-like [Cornus florida]
MSNISADGGSFSSGNTGGDEVLEKQLQQQHLIFSDHFNGSDLVPTPDHINDGSSSQLPVKKRRNLPGNPDPSAEVIALSPKTLMATNRFVCEICNKGFQRDQNLQLHRRGHNLPWKLKQRTSTEVRKRVYICPEASCVHHNPARALGDLTGIKKHFCRKHGEKKWKCDKCSKKYAVQSDWKAHSKTCGTKEYKCDCGTIFSRRDSFITHRAFCDALAEENNKVNHGLTAANMEGDIQGQLSDTKNPIKPLSHELMPRSQKPLNMAGSMFSSNPTSLFGSPRNMLSSSSNCLQLSANSSEDFNSHQIAGSGQMSATALLQKAAQMGATASSNVSSPIIQKGFATSMAPSSFNGLMPQQLGSSYDHIHPQTDQSQLAGLIGGFTSHFLQKGPQETSSSQFLDASNGVHDIGMYNNGLVFNQNEGLLKNTTEEHDDTNSNSNQGFRAPTSAMTVDFLGIGGMRPRNFRERQQQGMEFDEAISDQERMQGLNPFQQQICNGQATLEKHMWDV